jgi:hypothetical protein
MTDKLVFITCALLLASAGQIGSREAFLASYKGTPYTDQRYTRGIQPIPGRVESAFYDVGGEGIAYHDSDPVNHGSGELNAQGTTYQDRFRTGEGVDVSYTKFNKPEVKIDDSPFDKVVPPEYQLYVGWTVPGEWYNLSVNVAHDGVYNVSLLYTAHNDGTLTMDVNGVPQGFTIPVASTYDPKDPLEWRQWHHWNLGRNLAKLKLSAGKNVLTVHIASGGQMNLGFFDIKDAQ